MMIDYRDDRNLYSMEIDREADAKSGLLTISPGIGINFLPFPVQAGTRLIPTDSQRQYKLFFYTPDIPPELIHTYFYQQEANWTTYAPERSLLSWQTGEWISPEGGYIRIAVQSPPENAAIQDLFSFEPPYASDESVPNWMYREIDGLFHRSQICRTEGDVAILLLTDTHYTVGGIWPDTLKSLRLAADRLHPDAMVHLGDFSDGMLPGKLTQILAERMLIQLKEICEPLWCCLGNHDWNYFRGNPERMTRSACAKLYQGKDTPWYNVDFPDEKLRVLFMDTFDPEESNRYGFSKEQIRWLKHMLRTTPQGTKLLVFSHIPPVAEIHVWSDTIRNGEKVLKILERFHRWHGHAVLGWIHGHNHADQIYDKRAFPIIGIGCSKIEDFLEHKPEGSMTYPRQKGEKTQELWDLLLIHPSKMSMDFLRFGAGKDRHVELSNK